MTCGDDVFGRYINDELLQTFYQAYTLIYMAIFERSRGLGGMTGCARYEGPVGVVSQDECGVEGRRKGLEWRAEASLVGKSC